MLVIQCDWRISVETGIDVTARIIIGHCSINHPPFKLSPWISFQFCLLEIFVPFPTEKQYEYFTKLLRDVLLHSLGNLLWLAICFLVFVGDWGEE